MPALMPAPSVARSSRRPTARPRPPRAVPSPTLTPAADEAEWLRQFHPAAVKMAGKFKDVNPWLEYEDLLSVAMVAIVKAARTFRPELGNTKSTWAFTHLKGAVHAAVERYGENPAALAAFWSKARRLMGSDWQERVSDEDAARAMGVTVERLQVLRSRTAPPVVSLDAITERMRERSGDGAEYALPDPSEPVEDLIARRSVDGLIRAHVDGLPVQQRDVIRLTYEMDPPRTLQEVADIMGLSRERIRQVRTAALQALRARLEGTEALALAMGAPA